MTANERPPYRIDPLSVHHDRAAFALGVEPLDRYLRTQAGQDSRRRVASCFVLTPSDEPAQDGLAQLEGAGLGAPGCPG